MEREWSTYKNSRGYMVTRCEGEHVNLWDLKKDPKLDNQYLRKSYIPAYPKPVVFYVPDVKHVTDKHGRQGIFKDGGFRIQQYEENDNFLWFSLSLTEEEITEAEENFLLNIYPYWNAERFFLRNFTTSPAFQSESPYGNVCFTLSIRELLYLYARQFCGHSAPVFRELDTRLYKQEIMYSVLVHPRHIDRYRHYPRLPRGDENVCGYSEGYMSWSCQAPSGAHGYKFILNRNEGTLNGMRLGHKEYYVWDNVSLAFHMEPHWVLRVNRARLRNSMTVCELSHKNLLRYPVTHFPR